jgi:hypothetical protein
MIERQGSLNQGLVYWVQQPTQAIADFTTVIELKPRAAQAYHNRACGL